MAEQAPEPGLALPVAVAPIAAIVPPLEPGSQSLQSEGARDEAKLKPELPEGLTVDTVIRPCPPYIAWSHHAKKELGIPPKEASAAWAALSEAEKLPWMEAFRKDQQMQREQCELLGINVKDLPKRRPTKAQSSSQKAAAAGGTKSAPSTPGNRKRKAPAQELEESPQRASPVRPTPASAASRKPAAASGKGSKKNSSGASAGAAAASASSSSGRQVAADQAKLFPEFLQTANGPLAEGAFDTKTILPVNRTKRLVLRDPEVPRADKESVALINAAAELFIKELSRKVGMVASSNSKKVLRESDVVEVLEAEPCYQFLRAALLPVLAMSKPEGGEDDEDPGSEAPGADNMQDGE